ncbi:MAG: hypothetical protein ABIM60_06810 [candidate division WOR-3 bacterium]
MPEGIPCVVYVKDNKIFLSERKNLININGEVLWSPYAIKLSPDDRIADYPQIKRCGALLVVCWIQRPLNSNSYEIAYRVYTPSTGWGPVEIVYQSEEFTNYPNIDIKKTNIDYKIYFLFTKKSEPIYECIFRERSFIPYPIFSTIIENE